MGKIQIPGCGLVNTTREPKKYLCSSNPTDPIKLALPTNLNLKNVFLLILSGLWDFNIYIYWIYSYVLREILVS